MTNRIADYELLREIGRGDYGVVWLARPPARLRVADEFVAVKLFGDGTRVRPATFRRAVDELKAFGRLRSPHLVRLYDTGQEQGTFYYAMEYLARGSLAVPAESPSRSESLRALEDAARGAHDLHEAGIVHRDIKPGNILLHESGGRLADVGLAQVLAPGMTVTKMGGAKSLEFLDPAVLKGGRPSRASDIWALGVTLHIALTGTGVYPELDREDVLQAMRTVAARAPVPDAQLLPEERDLVLDCLAPEPLDRPRTALEVAERLEQLTSPHRVTRT